MAYEFAAASSQSLSVADNAALDITGALSVAVWMKSTGVYTSPVSHLCSKASTAADGRAYTLQLSSDGKVSSNNNSSGAAAQNHITTGATVVGTAWRHAAHTFSPSTFARVYLDGTQDAERTDSVPASIYNNAGTLNIGGLAGSIVFFNGLIAEVGVWNAALTAAEIASLAKGMTCDKVRPQSLVFYAPLVRNLQDVRGGLTITNNNTATVANHPRVYA
jgi:uncharacterized protein (DUF736 family)